MVPTRSEENTTELQSLRQLALIMRRSLGVALPICRAPRGKERPAAMKLELKIDGVDQPIELLRNGPDCRFRLGETPERAAHVETPEPGMYSVLLDGMSYDTSVEEAPTGLGVRY